MFARKTFYTLAALGLASGSLSLQAQGPAAVKPPEQTIVAEVNGVSITRQQLADELIARKGRAQLEALVHRTLIEQTCKAKNITVTDKEVQDELIAEMKASASANLADFEKSMLSPRRTSLFEYREDVIKPRILIQKLASSQLSVTEEDLKREFASKYGEKVAIRIITFSDPRIAKKTWGEIAGKPDVFIRHAKMQENGDLAASAGLLAPFGRHTTHDIIEQRAFELKVGEVSEVLQTPQKGFVIILKEHDLPAHANANFDQVKEQLRASALDKKRQTEVPKIIAELKNQANTKIKLFLNTEPNTRKLIDDYEKVFSGTSR